MTLVGVEEVK